MKQENYIAEPGLENLHPVRIDAKALDIIEKHGVEEYPYECCGFLYGAEGNVRVIREAKPVLNKVNENRKRRFEISPKDYLLAERYAIEHGLTLLGVYHSHPDHPAIPSIHDFRQAVPFFSYIIISVSENEVKDLRSWQLYEGHFIEEKVNPVTIKY
ncbi:MAG TPA: M67 family metallopeptidase [Cyclobacteriaceae bacterium]|nr:M67 family metallopeptidase [Cyclobacteriaceae bacterium]